MKVVVYTQRVEEVESYAERRDCADQRIGVFLKACGMIPIPLRNAPADMPDVFRQLRPCGVVLTGGNSLLRYGGNAPERDETDAACIRLAIEGRLPLYGFCRGMQSLLDYFDEELVEIPGHVAVRHILQGDIQREVNSYHGQGCTNLRTGAFVILAQTADGVIEAIRHRQYPFLGTMWHPEREKQFHEDDIQRVRALFSNNE